MREKDFTLCAEWCGCIYLLIIFLLKCDKTPNIFFIYIYGISIVVIYKILKSVHVHHLKVHTRLFSLSPHICFIHICNIYKITIKLKINKSVPQIKLTTSRFWFFICCFTWIKYTTSIIHTSFWLFW